MPPNGYKSTAIPDHLYERIERVVKARKGYSSNMEFVKEAVRLRLEDVEKTLEYGEDKEQTEKYCSKCGNKMSIDSIFCSKCGNKF